ncbi:MAG TPA: hypothetical protein VKI62_07560, partial [Bacteroidota bacterium]|nr:hypothetical protein [Bacteroidota bacterium]
MTVVSFFITFFHHNQGAYMDQQPTTAAPIELSSFMTRATNVFAAPSELFSELASTPAQNSSWSIPLILSVIVSILFVISMNSNPELRQQMAEPGRQ